MSILSKYKKRFQHRQAEVMSMEEYLKGIKKDPSMYASPAERMLSAIGKPELIDTSKHDRLGRIFGNRTIKRYKPFSDFYGMELVIDQIVSFFKHAAQGLEESKQVLYLLGPVGSAKSSLAERLKELMAMQPIYALEGSPIHESPLGLFSVDDTKELNVPERYLRFRPSPWALKRLEEFDGDISKFKVVKMYPSEAYQIGIAKTEPGDENNQDISTLVGKVDIRKLESLSQDDPDAYSYSGGLCKANQGILDFVEMFKAPIKMLHPLLTATQEGNYKGTEAIAAIPFDGIILAHSNESEWRQFRGNKNNEAFLDRISIVKVPYCLRLDEEVDIYKKLINSSKLVTAPCAPGTKEMLAKFCILSRLDLSGEVNAVSKMRVYNGEDIKGVDPSARSFEQYKDMLPDLSEGFSGVSTRKAFKILSKVYNYDLEELGANPVHMLMCLTEAVENEEIDLNLDDDSRDELLASVLDHLREDYYTEVGKDIQSALLDSAGEFGQSLFDRYILYADMWLDDKDYIDPETGIRLDRKALNNELEKIEKPAGIANPKDFRQEMVNYALRYQARNNGKKLEWTAHKKIEEVIEANMFNKTEDLLPILSFNKQGSKDLEEKHQRFVDRMVEKGYTPRQVQLVTEWHMRFNKSQ